MGEPSPDRSQPTADHDALLLVTPESGASYSELVGRLQERTHAQCASTGRGARAALATAASATPSHVVVVPFSFGAGQPFRSDVSTLLQWSRTQWPGTTFLQSEPVGSREHVIGWASQQARASVRCWPDSAPTSELALLVVGEGTTPMANAEVCALARLLWENRDDGIVEVAFAWDARSTIAMGIDRCHRLGARRIVVLPLSLLDGPFHEDVRAQTDAVLEIWPPGTVTTAAPLLTPAAAAAIVRHRYAEALARWLERGEDGCASAGAHHHDSGASAMNGPADVLPPRYRRGRVVSAASMRSAPLTYDAEGRVAWDRVWQSFCDLALAGGPPHRGTLLEPPPREDVLANPGDSARVASEIARGLSLVTGLRVVTDAAPGWVGLVCRDEDMAVWLLRAIVVENISVRREGATLFLPAGPAYRLEREIKNVITAVAKTHHYWAEHRASR